MLCCIVYKTVQQLQSPHMMSMQQVAQSAGGTPQPGGGPGQHHVAPPSSGNQTPTPSQFTMMPPSSTPGGPQTPFPQGLISHQMILQQQQGSAGGNGPPGAAQMAAYPPGSVPIQYAQMHHGMIGYLPCTMAQSQQQGQTPTMAIQSSSAPPHILMTQQQMAAAQHQHQQQQSAAGGGPAGSAGTPGGAQMMIQQQPGGQITSAHQFVQGHNISGWITYAVVYESYVALAGIILIECFDRKWLSTLCLVLGCNVFLSVC